jgi:DNA ligase (NAD+)
VQVEQRVAELRAAIRRADQLYHNLGRPELTDAEYDRLYRELRELETAHPELVTADSPTQRVGAPLAKGSSFATAAHLAPMGSIESLMTAAEVHEFVARARRALDLDESAPLTWACEPKLDGVSANLVYEHGRLVRGLSRGDGATGEDLTQNLRTVRNLPLRLLGDAPPATIEVRGEVVMTKAAFAHLQATAETSAEGTFRNARNTVAGTLKLLDPRLVQQRPLDFLAYGIGHADGLHCATHAALRAALRGFGFQVVEPFEPASDAAAIAAFRRLTRWTAWSPRSTTCSCSNGSAGPPARRAGRWPTSSRRGRRSRSSSRSACRSAAPAP